MAEPDRHEWDMTSPPDDVDTVHDLLAVVWDGAPTVSAGDRMRFETALIELASNVMRHADAGYESAIDCARANGLDLPSLAPSSLAL